MTTDVETGQATPTEVLIPEARQHRRRRNVKTLIVIGFCAVLLAALIAGAVVLFGGAPSGKSQAKPPTHLQSERSGGAVLFRPVLCFVPPFNSLAQAPATSSLSCDPAAALTAQNINVQPTGVSSTLASDASLAGAPTTKPTADNAGATVLLPGAGGACGELKSRCLLGPAQMSSAPIKSATVIRTHAGSWVVDFTMSSRNAALWDRVTSANFHQLLGIELNGVVYSAPIIQPLQSQFTSFDGKGEISGSLTKTEAIKLAKAMQSHTG